MGSRYALIAARGSSTIAPELLASVAGVSVEKVGRTQFLKWPASYCRDEGYAATCGAWTVLALPYEAVIASGYNVRPPPEAVEFLALGVEETAAEFWYQSIGARYLEVDGVVRLTEGTVPDIPKDEWDQTDTVRARNSLVPSELTPEGLASLPFEALKIGAAAT